MGSFEEHQRGAQAAYDAETVRADTAESRIATLSTQCDTLSGELAAARARIAELEAAVPPPATPTEPPRTPPAILDERFATLDWTRLFAEEGDDAADRQKFSVTPAGLTCVWTGGTSSKRSEIGIRNVPGGGETPRRDPIGSERWYLHQLTIPESYKLDDGLADQKRVLWQCHQSGDGIVNPPLSLELRNGTFRLVRSVGGERKDLLGNVPCVKGRRHVLLVHVVWRTGGDGLIECWFDGVARETFRGATCSQSPYGMNVKCGSYQPGYASFTNGYKIEHLIHRLAIGDERNRFEDFA